MIFRQVTAVYPGRRVNTDGTESAEIDVFLCDPNPPYGPDSDLPNHGLLCLSVDESRELRGRLLAAEKEAKDIAKSIGGG